MRTWTFGELEAALAQSHQISSSKRTAFQARLKNFHRLDFPADFSATKGRAAQYSGKQCCEMALVTELAQLGVPPDRGIKIHTVHAPKITNALISAAQTLLSDDRFPLLMIFDPAGLADLQDRGPDEAHVSADDAITTFEVMQIGKLAKQFSDWTEGYFRRAALINVTDMIDELAHRLAAISRVHEGDVLASFIESLRATVESDSNGYP